MTDIAVRGRPFPPGVSGNPNGRPVVHRTVRVQMESLGKICFASLTVKAASVNLTADVYGHLFPRADDGSELAAAERVLLA